MSEKRTVEEKSADPVAQEVLRKAAAAGVETAYDRHEQQGKRCPFGEKGVCCRICEMGPCRIECIGGMSSRK